MLPYDNAYGAQLHCLIAATAAGKKNALTQSSSSLHYSTKKLIIKHLN